MEPNIKPISIDDVPLNSFHQRLTTAVALGWLMVGYVMSIISVAALQSKEALHPSDSWSGIIGGAALTGLFIGAFTGGMLTDHFGRRRLYFISPTVIIIRSLVTQQKTPRAC